MQADIRLVALLLTLLCSAAHALAPGDHEFSVRGGLAERRYIVVVPQSPPPKPALVLNFHGGGGNPVAHRKYVQMDAFAAKHGFLVAYPYGNGPLRERLLTWNGGACCGPAATAQVDDVGFVRALLDDLPARIDYDRWRVYATGLSNGAMMSYRLATELSDRIAAVAPVAGSMVVLGFDPPRPVPVMHVHSVDDARALYDGGLGPAFPMTDTRVFHPPVEERLADWAKANGCAPAPVQAERREWTNADGALHTATRLEWQGCRAPVALWKLTGAGHVWPGGELDYLPRLLGPGRRVIDANEEMWRFFSRHALPQR